MPVLDAQVRQVEAVEVEVGREVVRFPRHTQMVPSPGSRFEYSCKATILESLSVSYIGL
jgi:hypothetical protein